MPLEICLFQCWCSVTAFMKVLFVLGMGLMLAAPLLRRRFGLAHLDPRFGQAANESDRRFYHLFLACEIPVLVLALIFFATSQMGILAWLGNQPRVGTLFDRDRDLA